MSKGVYIAAIIDRVLCALIDSPKSDHYQFAALGALRNLKADEASMVKYGSEEEAKTHLEEIAAESTGKQWKVFLVPVLDEANPAMALGFRVRAFLDALDEFGRYEEDGGDEAYESAKEDLADTRLDLEAMDAAVSIHNALQETNLATVKD